jgi:hypothetical protein
MQSIVGAIRVRGVPLSPPRSEVAERAPHPNPLPAKGGEREKMSPRGEKMRRVGRGALRAVPTILSPEDSRWARFRFAHATIYPPHWLALAMTVSVGDQRATTLVERTESLVAGNGGEQLVEVPFVLGL